MIFDDEYLTLYICQYLHPDDITALARTGHSIRAMIIPHMRYRVSTAEIDREMCSVTCIYKTFARFDRSDVTYALLSDDETIRPNPIPRDYTGVISVYMIYPLLYHATAKFLWADEGIVCREIGWRNDFVDMYVAKMDPIHFVNYFLSDEDYWHELNFGANAIFDRIRNIHMEDDFEASDEFVSIMRDIDSL